MLEATIEEIEQKLIDNQTPATFEYTTLTIKDLTPTLLSIEMEVFFKHSDGHIIHIDIAYLEDLDSSEPVIADKFVEDVNRQ